MNARQLARRRLHASYRINEMKRGGIGQRADAAVGVTPIAKRLHLAGDCFIRMLGGGLGFKGIYTVEHWFREQLVDQRRFVLNGITNEGLNDNLGVYIDSVTQPTTFYMGLIDNAGFSALAATDDYDNINQSNGWDEFTDYTDANNSDNATTRPVWPNDAPSGQSITNAGTQSIFDITAGGTIHGIFIVTKGTAPQTKDDHAAGSILWSTAPFSGGNITVSNGSQIRATYTVNASSV